MKKKILLLLVSTLQFYCQLSAQSCLPNGITFSTQIEIDEFSINYSGCSIIEGNVNISNSNISNLNGLSQIESIEGDFSINDNPDLITLEGLEGLNFVIGELLIYDNKNLESFLGLEFLSSVGDRLLIKGNNTLTNLAGLDSLITVGSLEIRHNNQLENLEGLEGLNSVQEGYLSVNNSSNLVSIKGLDSLTIINGDLFITLNPLLNDLNSFGNLTRVNFLSIAQNHSLESLNGFEGLTSIGNALQISDNDLLTDISGLENVSTIGGALIIVRHELLEDLSSLINLKSIDGFIRIRNNESLTSLHGIDSIDHITIYNSGDPDDITLDIRYNPNLTVCHVKSICDYLGISTNDAMISENFSDCNTRLEVEEACQIITSSDVPQNIEVTISPNPTTGKFIISGIEGSVLKIRNNIGIILQEDILNNSEIDITSLPSGIYYLEIISEKKMRIMRILKH